jgi:hypothetical protein
MDLLTEARGHGVHEQPRGGTLDLHIVRQPISTEHRHSAQGEAGSMGKKHKRRRILSNVLHNAVIFMPGLTHITPEYGLHLLSCTYFLYVVANGNLDAGAHKHNLFRLLIVAFSLHGRREKPDSIFGGTKPIKICNSMMYNPIRLITPR